MQTPSLAVLMERVCKITLWLIRKLGLDDTFNYFLENGKILLKKTADEEKVVANIKYKVFRNKVDCSRVRCIHSMHCEVSTAHFHLVLQHRAVNFAVHWAEIKLNFSIQKRIASQRELHYILCAMQRRAVGAHLHSGTVGSGCRYWSEEAEAAASICRAVHKQLSINWKQISHIFFTFLTFFTFFFTNFKISDIMLSHFLHNLPLIDIFHLKNALPPSKCVTGKKKNK